MEWTICFLFMFVDLFLVSAYTVDTFRSDFDCPNIMANTQIGYTDTSDNYVDVPVYVGLPIVCTIRKNSTLKFYFAMMSLGLGVKSDMSMPWTLFYGMEYGVTLETSLGQKLNQSYFGFRSIAIDYPPVSVLFSNPTINDLQIILPSIFVTVQSVLGIDSTSSIVGSTVLSLTFIVMLAMFRRISVS